MEEDLKTLEACGIDLDTGIGYTGSREKYFLALQRFCGSYGNNRAKIDSALAREDHEQLQILVHSLKSNARMIGALSLSAKFEALEMAAKNRDTETIRTGTPDALSDYESIVKDLESVGTTEKPGADDSPSAGEASEGDVCSPAKAREIADGLLAALEDYDDEAGALLAEKLAGYPFAPPQQELLRKASGYIREYLYDEAAELIRQIAETIG